MSLPVFVRLNSVDPNTKDELLRDSVQRLRNLARDERSFVVDQQDFRKIQGSPFAYWVDPELRALFEAFAPLASAGRVVSIGASSKDDFRFLRLWNECSPRTIAADRASTTNGARWVRFAKGGSFGRYYAALDLVIDWYRDGAIIKTAVAEYRGVRGWGYQWSAALNGHDYYFRAGLTWPRRTNGLSFRVLPAGCIFADKGPAVFVHLDGHQELLALLGVLCSPIFEELVRVQLARTELAQSYERNIIAATPVPARTLTSVSALSAEAVDLLRREAATRETTAEFSAPRLLLAAAADSLSVAVATLQEHDVRRKARLAHIHSEVTELVFDSFGVSDELKRQICEAEGLVPRGDQGELASSFGSNASRDEEELVPDEGSASCGDPADVADLLSWCLGVAAGRWDARMARDSGLIPALQGAFEPLPRVAPCGLIGPDGLPATEQAIASEAWLRARPNVITLPPVGSFTGPAALIASEYPIPVAWDGVLVDDEGHERDLVATVRRVLAYVYGDRADAMEAEALELLRGEDGGTPKTLRDWFRSTKAAALGKSFFDHHIGRYSKSRRKAPIYWRLAASANAPYAVWLYYPRLSKDTLWRVLGDYVTPRRALAERQLAERRAVRDAAPAGPARRRAEQAVTDAVALLESVQALEAELRRVSERGYAPDLDDGVVISAAPLHKVIPWKEPAAVWKKLEVGDYDWAKLAMALWPERVRSKCETDRSLAMAHGLA